MQAIATSALALATLVGTHLPAQAADVAPPADLGGWACTGACAAVAPGGDVGASPTGHAAFGVVTTAGSTATGVSPVPVKDNNTGMATNGSRWRSGSFAAASGDRLSLYFNYVSTDGNGYDDFAWARVVNADDASLVSWLFAARSTNSSTGKVVPGDLLDNKAFDPDQQLVGFKDWSFTSKTSADPVDFAPLGDSNGTCWEDDAKGCGTTGWMQSLYRFDAAGTYRVEVGVSNWGDTLYDSALAFDYQTLTATAPVPEPGTLPLLASGLALMGVVLRRRRA